MHVFDKREIEENHKRYIERIDLYKTYGYDSIAEREFILECAGPLDGKILEIGTGKGYLTVTAARNGYSFITVDPSEENQRFAKLNAAYYGVSHRIDFRTGDVYSLEFPEAVFDVAIFVNTYHHIGRAQDALEEINRILAPGGRLILSDFTEAGFDLVEKVHESEGYHHDRGSHPRGYAFRSLKEMGFTIRTENSDFQYVLIASKPR